jgi:hypothetical protein
VIGNLVISGRGRCNADVMLSLEGEMLGSLTQMIRKN